MKKYVFKPYQENFPDLFSAEKKRIASAIDESIDIQHVGSTAVPGLGGKGIIDIAIATNKESLKTVAKALEELGYEYREVGSVPGRLFFKIKLADNVEGKRTYHIHLTYPECQEWKSLISFRDYLRDHPDKVVQYETFKKEAAEKAKGDGDQYRAHKKSIFKINE